MRCPWLPTFYITATDERPLPPQHLLRFALHHWYYPTMTLQTPPALAEILARPNTIKFRDDSDEADFGDLDLSTNPQKSPSGPFLWVLPDRVTEATYTVAAKVFYSGIGNKTGPYFSLPDSRWVRPFFTYFFHRLVVLTHRSRCQTSRLMKC